MCFCELSIIGGIHRLFAILGQTQYYCLYIQFYASSGKIRAGDVSGYFSYLAVDRHVSPNTQNQALNALRHVLNLSIDEVNATRAAEQRRIPVVLNTDVMSHSVFMGRVSKAIRRLRLCR